MDSLILRSAAATVLLGCVLSVSPGCTSASDPSGQQTTASTRRPDATSRRSEPTVEGAYGCGPADAREITISSRGLPDEPVVAQVVFDGVVRNRSESLRGPDIEVTLQPDLPDEAYARRAAQVRIVSGSEVIVSANVQPGLPTCG